MPRVLIRCKCGHEYETITGATVSGEDWERCPACKAPLDDGEKVFGGARSRIRTGRLSLEDLTPEERARIDVQTGLDAKADYEEMAEQILSGEVSIDESRSVREFMPEVPERLRKRYF